MTTELLQEIEENLKPSPGEKEKPDLVVCDPVLADYLARKLARPKSMKLAKFFRLREQAYLTALEEPFKVRPKYSHRDPVVLLDKPLQN